MSNPKDQENKLSKLIQKQKAAEDFLQKLKEEHQPDQEIPEEKDDRQDIDPNRLIGCGG